MFSLKQLITMFSIVLCLSTDASADSPKNNFLTHPRKNPIAPEFVLQDMAGKQYALSDYKGKIVVVNFWASWCPPCVAEMPSMQRAADKLAKHGIQILGIGAGETRESVLRFLKSTPVSFPLLLDSRLEVVEKWSILSLPMPVTFIIDQEGRVALFAVGKREWDDPKILEQITSLQQTPPVN